MGIQDFFTTYFVVNRADWKTDNQGNAYSDEEEVGYFYGHIQEAEAGLVESLGMSFTSPYAIWCPVGTDVKAGDTLSGLDGKYSVKAIQKYNIGNNKHLQLVVQLDEVIGS